jgi:Fur family ferric uptake transcriptional regulator
VAPSTSDLVEKLKMSGYKLTPARLAVIEVLESDKIDHLNHNQILEEGKKIYPRLGRANVYRTMELLVELNLFRPLYLNDATQRFISASGGHHHLICANCGKTIEFDHCTVNQLADELAARYDFRICSHLLEFQGLCAACR